MRKILIRFCVTVLSILCFCSGGVFAMFSEGSLFPSTIKVCGYDMPVLFEYNSVLREKRYYPKWIIEPPGDCVVTDKGNEFVQSEWSMFWWTREMLRNGKFNYEYYKKICRSYPLLPVIEDLYADGEKRTKDKERVIKAFRSLEMLNVAFYFFLEDYFDLYLKKYSLNWFESSCLWKVMYGVNSSFVEGKLGKDWYEYRKLVPPKPEDFEACFSSKPEKYTYPFTKHTMCSVRFIAESLCYMNLENLAVFFATLYEHFFERRFGYFPEQIFMIYSGLEKMSDDLMRGFVFDHSVTHEEKNKWFTYLNGIRDRCNPYKSSEFKGRATSLGLRYMEIKK